MTDGEERTTSSLSITGDPSKIASMRVNTQSAGDLFGNGDSTPPTIYQRYRRDAQIVIAEGDTRKLIEEVPDGSIKLIITSPPYNLGKEYELKTHLERYLDDISPILEGLVRVLHPGGSLCWQVGNYVKESEVFPLDIFFYPRFKSLGLKLRNRVIWHFEHGLHASKRFSGRYETLLWFTKGDKYTFNLNSVRIPSKYPGKTFWKGKKRGLPSGNPLGKNPSDFWSVITRDWETAIWNIPNVKANHPEKTIHPCQFPIELVERCVLALTDESDWVLDPFSGVGSALLAALRHKRRAFGCDKERKYCEMAKDRIHQLYAGTLKYRPLGRPIFQPTGREKVSQIPFAWVGEGK